MPSGTSRGMGRNGVTISRGPHWGDMAPPKSKAANYRAIALDWLGAPQHRHALNG
jgi:hypothetical protein